MSIATIDSPTVVGAPPAPRRETTPSPFARSRRRPSLRRSVRQAAGGAIAVLSVMYVGSSTLAGCHDSARQVRQQAAPATAPAPGCAARPSCALQLKR